jgi:hypothetical protein
MQIAIKNLSVQLNQLLTVTAPAQLSPTPLPQNPMAGI